MERIDQLADVVARIDPAAFPGGETGLLVLLGLLAAGFVLWALSARLRETTGLSSSAKVVASDTGQNRVEKIADPETGLVGQPDFILAERVGLLRRERLVPVEVKPSRRSSRLYESDEMQCVVYLLLMRAKYGRRAAEYGYVRYKEDTFRVELTGEREKRCLQYAKRVRWARQADDVHRDHEISGRCRACSVRDICSESLA